jgi:hypothetical protein
LKKTTKLKRKGGRPRKTLDQLFVTGGYDRNPGRLLKRLGIKEAEEPPEPEPDQELIRRWDIFERKVREDYAREGKSYLLPPPTEPEK